MSLDCAAEFSLSHDIIATPHCSCQEVSEEASEAPLGCVELTVARKSPLRTEQQKKQQSSAKNRTIEKGEVEAPLGCVELAVVRRSLC